MITTPQPEPQQHPDPQALAGAIRRAIADCAVKRIFPVLPWRPMPAQSSASGLLRLTMVLRGQRHVCWPWQDKNRLLPLKRGEMIVVTPMAWSQNRSQRPHRVMTIDCYPAFTRFMLGGFHSARRFPDDGRYQTAGPMAPAARALLQALVQVTLTEDEDRIRPILHCFLGEVLHECRHWADEPAGLRDWQRAVSLMHDDHLLTLSRVQIATHVDVHPNHLSRLCKKFTGQSLADYITTVRMQRACYYLRNASCSIAEVVQLAGYHDETHFRKRFKQVYGLPPGEWRREALLEQARL
jgi:AraC-like DNA-binding protein